jgi:hypothetical protein
LPSRAKYKQITDLYVRGQEIVLRDGNVIWLQALNPFEMEEARHGAQVVRSRIVLALREEGSDEMAKARAYFFEDGTEMALERLLNAEMRKALVEISETLHEDAEWTERIEVIERSQFSGVEPNPEEAIYLEKITTEYGEELSQRFTDETDFRRRNLVALDEDGLWEVYRENYLEGRGGEVALREFTLGQLLASARACDGAKHDDGWWDHSACGSHKTHVFEDKSELRDLPEELYSELAEAMAVLFMTERQAKNLGRQGNSSASSPLPSEVAESPRSTPTGISPNAPGTSMKQ